MAELSSQTGVILEDNPNDIPTNPELLDSSKELSPEQVSFMNQASANEVIGHFHGIAKADSYYYLSGWTCSIENPSSLKIRVYMDNPSARGGKLLGESFANKPAETSVTQRCRSTGSLFRFWTRIDISQLGGRVLYVEGVDPRGTASTELFGSDIVPKAPIATTSDDHKVLFILDTSGSNEDTDFTGRTRISSIQKFLNLHRQDPKYKWGLITFSNDARQPFAGFKDSTEMDSALSTLTANKILRASGCTNYEAALNLTYDTITKDLDSNSAYDVFFISDGFPTNSSCSTQVSIEDSLTDPYVILARKIHAIAPLRVFLGGAYYSPLAMDPERKAALSVYNLTKHGGGKFADIPGDDLINFNYLTSGPGTVPSPPPQGSGKWIKAWVNYELDGFVVKVISPKGLEVQMGTSQEFLPMDAEWSCNLGRMGLADYNSCRLFRRFSNFADLNLGRSYTFKFRDPTTKEEYSVDVEAAVKVKIIKDEGPITARTVVASLDVNTQDVGRLGAVYVIYRRDENSPLWFMGPDRVWVKYDGTVPPVPFFKGALSSHYEPVLATNADLTPQLIGEVFLGYGLGPGPDGIAKEMKENLRVLKIYTVHN